MDEIGRLEIEDLREKILDLNREQLGLLARISNNYFLIEEVKLKARGDKNQLLIGLDRSREKDRILEIYDIFLRTSRDINTDFQVDIDMIIGLREELCNYTEILSTYYLELEKLSQNIEYRILKEREDVISINSILQVKEKKLVENIENILKEKTDNYLDYIEFMSKIVNILPFRLSKYKYYDLLKNTLYENLAGNSKSQVEYQIKEYKKQYCPNLVKGYGLYFDDYFREVEILKRRELEDLNLLELEDFSRDINKVLEKIASSFLNLRRIGLLSNHLLTIFLIKKNHSLDLDLPREDNLDNLDKSIVDMEKRLFALVEEFKVYNDELYSRGDRSLDSVFDGVSKDLIFYNDVDFKSLEALEALGDEEIEEDYLKKLIDIFIDFIDRNNQTMEAIERRIRMKSLLVNLRPPFAKLGDFMGYLSYSLDPKITYEKERNMTLLLLNYLVEKELEIKDSSPN